MSKKIVMYALCSLCIMPIAYAAMHSNEKKKVDIKNLKDCKQLSDYHAQYTQTRRKNISGDTEQKGGDDHGTRGNNNNAAAHTEKK